MSEAIDTSRDWLPEAHRADPAFSKYESMDALLGGFKAAQSFIGADKATVMKIPASNDDAAGWDDVYAKLGRPASPAEYGLDIKDGDPDKGLWEKALPNIYKLGLTKRQVEGLRGMLGEMGQEYSAQFADPAKAVEHFIPRAAEALASEAFADATAAMLKQAWGQAYDDKFHAANRVAGMFADTQNPEIAKLFKAPADGGYGLANLPGFIAMLADIGERLAEPGALTGGAGQNQGRKMTPQEAAAAISAMNADPAFREAYMADNPEAKARWNAANAALVG